MIIDVTKLSTELTNLCKIMISNGSDKAGGWHNYTLVYDELFKDVKSNIKNIFELGIGTINSGASLRGWKEYFKKANIYGADIDSKLLFEDEQIKTFQCDQTSEESIAKLWSNFKNFKFDLILEDGLHTYDANISFLENSLHKVKQGGFYVIEDILVSDIERYSNYFKNCTLDFKQYQLIELENEGNKQDNVLVIIKR